MIIDDQDSNVADKKQTNFLTQSEKDSIIEKCLSTQDGLDAFRQTFSAPINRSLDYMSIGRKILMVDELPTPRPADADCFYPPNTKTFYQVLVVNNGSASIVPCHVDMLGDSVAHCKIDLSTSLKHRPRPFWIVDHGNVMTMEYFRKRETEIITQALIQAAEMDDLCIICVGDLNVPAFFKGFALLQDRGNIVSKVVMHPKNFKKMQEWGRDYFDSATTREILTSNLFGHIQTADIHVTTDIDPGVILFTACPDHVGSFTIFKEVTCDKFEINENKKVITREDSSQIAINIMAGGSAIIKVQV